MQSLRVRHDSRLTVFHAAGAYPVQRNFVVTDPVPSWLEDSRLQHYPSATIVVNGVGVVDERVNPGHVEGAGRVIAESNKLTDSKRFAVLLVIGSVGVGFGAHGAVGQKVGYDALIASMSSVISKSIGGLAKAFHDGAGPTPCGDMLCTASSFVHLQRGGRNSDFYLVSNLKRFCLPALIKPSCGFISHEFIVCFCQLAKSTSGYSHSCSKLFGETEFLLFVNVRRVEQGGEKGVP